MPSIEALLEDLRSEIGASRVTFRQDAPGGYAFPVTHEALAPGVASLLSEHTVDLRTQPVVRELARGRQVVQPDCRAAYEDPAFQAMLAAYGGLAAQIVTPIFLGERLAAILSLHQLGRPRAWSKEEADACARAAAELARRLTAAPEA